MKGVLDDLYILNMQVYSFDYMYERETYVLELAFCDLFVSKLTKEDRVMSKLSGHDVALISDSLYGSLDAYQFSLTPLTFRNYLSTLKEGCNKEPILEHPLDYYKSLMK